MLGGMRSLLPFPLRPQARARSGCPADAVVLEIGLLIALHLAAALAICIALDLCGVS
jgi:hypothetical protein